MAEHLTKFAKEYKAMVQTNSAAATAIAVEPVKKTPIVPQITETHPKSQPKLSLFATPR